MDGLRARASVFLVLGDIVSGKSAMKAFPLTNAFGSFGGGKFRQGDGVRVRGGSRVG